MTSIQWRSLRFIALSLAFALIGLAVVAGGKSAQAAPADDLDVFSEQCFSDGRVQVTFIWDPSGQGTQWFDITRLPNFAAFGNQGPLSASTNSVQWTLDSNTTYYARVTTFTQAGGEVSDILQFKTRTCAGAFSPPHNVDADVFNDFVRIDWDAGNGNLFYCVDTAFTQADLLEGDGSWHNWGCGTTSTSLDLTNLACNREHYFRVWAAGNGTSGFSEVGSFVSPGCDFSPPTNPDADLLSDNSVRISWTRGTNNAFFCVDYALNTDDLEEVEGTWRNAACGTTGTSADIFSLQCDTTYYYRIWAAGPGTSGYSPIDSFATQDCDFNPPINLETTVIDDETVLFEWEEQDPSFWFCVDVAGSEADLLGFEDSWVNFDCGDTDESAEVESDYFDCGETYYWRVFANAGDVSGHSEVASFEMDCP